MLLLLACVTQAPPGYGDTAANDQVTRPGGSNDQGGSEDDTEDGRDDQGPDPVVEPVEGVWVILSSSVTSDDCNAASLFVGQVVGETLTLTMQSTDAFDFERSDGVLEQCKLDGDGGLYACAERFEDFDGNDYGYDGTLHLTYSPLGEFQDPERSFMDIATVATCSGPDCGEVEDVFSTSFPCEMGFSLDAMLE